MIVTVTLNPALHVAYEAQHVRLGRANLVCRVRYRAGGRGLAVARVLHTFGHDVTAAGLAGGAAGEMIRADLAAAGVATQFTKIGMESRRVLEVADAASGQTTTFGEPAPYITTEELGRLAADYRALMDGATAAVLCGSLPDSLPPETYATLASYAADAGIPAIVDAGGSALLHALTRRPALAVPELPAAHAGGPAAHAGALIAGGVGAVAYVSSDAVRVVTAEGEWQARLAAREQSGPEPGWSRDAMVAGLVPGIVLGWSWPDMLRHAVALAAADGGPGGEVDLDRYEALLSEVSIDSPPA